MMFTPIKITNTGVLNETVLNTPQPQATSTVYRKNTMQSRFIAGKSNEEKHKQIVSSCEEEIIQIGEDTETPMKENSLLDLDNISVLTNIGIPDENYRMNYSNADAELEFARKLLRKCDVKSFSLNIGKERQTYLNKENNNNVQNVTNILSSSNIVPSNETYVLESSEEYSMNKANTADVSFEPNEIIARSSCLNVSRMQSPLNKSTNDINFNVPASEIMASFNKEEYPSVSQMIEKLSAGEATEQNCTYTISDTSTEKHELDLSSFSGIIGQLDLSIESCPGKKIPVDQYFKRKCNDIGVPGSSKGVITSLGCITETPTKENGLKPLVDSTVVKDAQISVPEIKLLLQNPELALSFNDKLDVPRIPSKIDIKSGSEEERCSNISVLTIPKKEIIKDISDSRMGLLSSENTNTGIKTDINHDIIIGKNTEQLCSCIIGMTCEANVELVNEGDKWITYSLKLHEIRGDEQNIILNIVQDAILIKPYGIQSAKIQVKVTKMCDPFIAILNIIVSDMVIKSKWCMKHIICFKPEELELDIICDSDKQELDFQYVRDNSTKVLPITFHNKNSTDVPIKLVILHDETKMFSIHGSFNESVKLNESRDELTHLVVKSRDKFTARIKCERLQSISMDDSQRQLQCWKSKLVIHIQCSDGIILFIKEVPLYARAGICEIQVVDTDMPIVVSRRQGKLLNIINSGNMMTNVSSIIVPAEECPTAAQYFSIKPDDILLQPGERGSFLITYESQTLDTEVKDSERHAEIKLVAGNNVYHFWLTKENIKCKPLTSEDENYLHCDMSCNVVSTSSPISLRSTSSNRSSSDNRSLPSSTVSSTAAMGNIIPVKATHTALIWNSVKTGKNEVKEFTIRNMSNNKIKIQIDILDDNNSFKFLGNQQTVSTSMVLAMQRTECKTLTVVFSPYRTGPAIGKITIKLYSRTRESSESQHYRRISLYGYGGYGTVKISNICKDTSGNMWLPLGTLSSETTILRTEIRLQNTGDLPSFAKIKIIPKVISLLNISWHLNLEELILSPKEARRLSVEYHPKKEDFAILQHSGVSHVATISIIYGDEPIRWRIRKLYNKIKESGELTGNENEAFKNIVQPICKTFPREQPIDLLSTCDSIENLSNLCTSIYQSKIMLTVEMCTDDTLPILHDTDDKSQIYYSLINDNSHVNEMDRASFFISQSVEGREVAHFESSEDNFTVTPSTIVLNPPICNEATVIVASFFKVAQSFQTSLSNSNYFNVSPTEGMLPSMKDFPLKIRCSQKIERDMQATLEIYTENNKQDVLIKVNVKKH